MLCQRRILESEVIWWDTCSNTWNAQENNVREKAKPLEVMPSRIFERRISFLKASFLVISEKKKMKWPLKPYKNANICRNLNASQFLIHLIILTLEIWGTDDFNIWFKVTEQVSGITKVQTQNIHLQITMPLHG